MTGDRVHEKRHAFNRAPRVLAAFVAAGLATTVGADIGVAQQVAPGIGPTVPNVGRLVPLTPTIGPNVRPLGTGGLGPTAPTAPRPTGVGVGTGGTSNSTPTTTTTPTNTPTPGTTSTNAGANPNRNIEPRTPGSSGGGAGEFAVFLRLQSELQLVQQL